MTPSMVLAGTERVRWKTRGGRGGRSSLRWEEMRGNVGTGFNTYSTTTMTGGESGERGTSRSYL